MTPILKLFPVSPCMVCRDYVDRRYMTPVHKATPVPIMLVHGKNPLRIFRRIHPFVGWVCQRCMNKSRHLFDILDDPPDGAA